MFVENVLTCKKQKQKNYKPMLLICCKFESETHKLLLMIVNDNIYKEWKADNQGS